MTTLAFLEATINSEGATTFAEDNKSIIDFATREVDLLVEEESTYIAENIGAFIGSDSNITYESIEDPISDVVIEATSAFGSVIADTSLSYSEQKEVIEGIAHMIAMGDSELVSMLEAGAGAGVAAPDPGVVGFAKDSLGRATKAGAAALVAGKGALAAGGVSGAAVGGALGAVGGAALGTGIAGIAKLFSKERKAWKALVAEEKKLKEQGGNSAKLEKIAKAKAKAKAEYTAARNKAMKRGAAIGGAAGAVGGAAAGYVGTKAMGIPA